MSEPAPTDEQQVLSLLTPLFATLRPRPDAARRLEGLAPDVAARLAERARRGRARFELYPRAAAPEHAADMALVLRARQGDAAAVNEVRRRLEGMILGRIYARGLGWNEDELLELVMARVWEKLALYKGQASLTTWAFRLTGNYLSNWVRDRAAAARRFVPLRGDEGIGVDPEHLSAPPPFRADFAVEDAERQARARWLLSEIARIAAERLRPEEWELIQRVVMHGERYEVLAAELGVHPGTLRVRLFRALRRLRGPLAEALGDAAAEYLATG